MTDAEKIAAFDNLAVALTNCWWDGSWCWWNPTPACGTGSRRATQDEALADLVAWAAQKAKKKPRPLPQVKP